MSKFRFAFYALALIVSLGFGLPQVLAQQPASQSEAKIAFVNSLEFSENIIEFRQQAETLDREFKPQTDQLQKLAEQLQLDEEALRRTLQDLQPDARQRRVEELEKAKKDYDRRVEDLKEAVGKRSIVALDPLRQKIKVELDKYAKARGVSLILDLGPAIQSGTLAYIDPQADVTRDFIENYNRSFPGKK